MKIGDKLDNGAVVLDFKQVNRDEFVILAEFGGHAMPYVTWRYRAGACYWGHYYRHLFNAKSDFYKRGLTSAYV